MHSVARGVKAFGRGLYRFLQICAFIAAIVTAVATAGQFLKNRPAADPAPKDPGIHIGDRHGA